MGRRGFHLMELLIAMMVMTLLLTASSRFLVTSFRLSTEGAVQANMQNQAVLAMHKMLLDLQRSNAAGLTRRPDAFGVVRMTTLTSLRTLVWEEQQIIYFRDPVKKQLFVKTWPPAPPQPATLGVVFDLSQPPRITPTQLGKVLESTNGREKLLVTDVETFSLAGENGLESMALTLVQSVMVRDHKQTFELTRVVGLRNHL